MNGSEKTAQLFSTHLEIWMGILNLTPDSFSDGGKFKNDFAALEHAQFLVTTGAHVVDVGGVSTRPGSDPLSFKQEWTRVKSVLRKMRQILPQKILISLDTSSSQVALRAAQEGLIDIVNDVFAGLKSERIGSQSVSILDIAAKYNLAVVLMHMQGEPKSMQQLPTYESCVTEICEFLSERAQQATDKGITSIILDPGIGFGKSFKHNIEILSERGIAALAKLGHPVLIGLSRKRFLEKLSEGTFDPEKQQLDDLSKDWEKRCLNWGTRMIRSHRMPLEF